MKARKFICLLILGMNVITACQAPVKNDGRKAVTVSILPLKYFVDRIGNNTFDVNVLVPPGAGPETWEPAPADMVKLSKSSVFFYTGYLEFEPVLADKLIGKGPDLQDLSKGVNLIKGMEETHGGHMHLKGVDPHYWVSPVEAKVFAANILEVLSQVEPARKNEFTQNYQQLMLDIDSLDHYIHKKLDARKMRVFLIYHPALTYYARDYGLKQLSIESEGKQPSTVHIRELIDLANRNKIKHVFVQKQFDRQVTESIARELGAELVPVDHLSADWLNNMYHMTDLIDKALHE